MIALVFWCLLLPAAFGTVLVLTFLALWVGECRRLRRERQHRRVAATTRVILYPERHRTVHAELVTKRAPRR